MMNRKESPKITKRKVVLTIVVVGRNGGIFHFEAGRLEAIRHNAVSTAKVRSDIHASYPIVRNYIWITFDSLEMR